jgi:hypothetical protein
MWLLCWLYCSIAHYLDGCSNCVGYTVVLHIPRIDSSIVVFMLHYCTLIRQVWLPFPLYCSIEYYLDGCGYCGSYTVVFHITWMDVVNVVVIL